MDFTALKAEFTARGFDYLSATRQNQYVNRGYHWICEQAQWPFLFTSATGAAPLTVADLREVQSVQTTVNEAQLEQFDVEDVLRIDPSLNDTGNAAFWYATSSTVIAVWPPNAGPNIKVYYVKVPVDLSAGGDIPLVPTRYHLSIVDYAVKLAYEDSDNFAAAQALQQKIDGDMTKMTQTLLHNEREAAKQMMTK